jgi:hypothetical protein
MNTFCTIITADYLPKAIVLYKSLKVYDENVLLEVLIVDEHNSSSLAPVPEGIHIVSVKNLSGNPLLDSIYERYAHPYIDHFRWALKPLFLSYLIERFDKVIYVDCDIYFTNDYTFLLRELDQSSVLLTPHWHSIDPVKNERSFIATFTEGIFNAGFIAVNKHSTDALQWWLHACHFKMGSFANIGIQDDQKYLDIFPVFFEGTKIIQHKGCNVAAWNTENCRRTLINGNVLINDEFPIIFIHFNDMLIKQILRGHDPLLVPFLDQYVKLFEAEGFSLSSFTKEINYYLTASAIKKLKWKLKTRARIKSLLYKLAQRV